MVSDAELVKRVLSGEQSCFAELINRYERSVRAAAVRILYDLHLGEDCAQETFIKAYDKLGSLRKASMFGSWIMQIARREALSILRKRKNHDSLETVGELPASQSEDFDEETRFLLDAVMKLSASRRQTVMLRYFEGMPVRTIAKITDRSVGTVTKQLTRAREQLRNLLGALEL